MVWRAASGAGSTISGPTSGPQFSLPTPPSSPGASRSDSRLRQTLAGPLIPGRSLIRTLRPSRRISPRNRQMDQNGIANRSPLATNAARDRDKTKWLWTGPNLDADEHQRHSEDLCGLGDAEQNRVGHRAQENKGETANSEAI